MELKAVKEYEEPKYQTKEDNKKGILRFILNGGKFSLSIAIMCLLMNGNAMGSEFAGMMPMDYGDGLGYYEEPSLGVNLLFQSISGAIVLLSIYTIIRLTMNNKAIKIILDEEERKKLEKRRNKEFFIGLGVTILLICLFFVLREVIY